MDIVDGANKHNKPIINSDAWVEIKAERVGARGKMREEKEGGH